MVAKYVEKFTRLLIGKSKGVEIGYQEGDILIYSDQAGNTRK